MALGTFTPTKTAKLAAKPQGNTDAAAETREQTLEVVTRAAEGAERNVQVAIGPSEAGHPCARNIAHKLAQTPAGRDLHDPWPSVVGTAVHAWMGEAFQRENERLVKAGQSPRYLMEHRVYPDPTRQVMQRGGSGDLFDAWTGTVEDHKVLGDTQHRKYTTGYVSDQYQVQLDLYGLGFANEGWDVRSVALLVWKRPGTLRDLYVYQRPWNRANAEAAIARLRQIQLVVSAGIDPMNVKASAVGECHFCPWRPTCPEGKNAR